MYKEKLANRKIPVIGSGLLLVAMLLGACGDASTAVSQGGTAVAGAGTAASGSINQAATAGSGALTQVATVAPGAVQTAGTAVAGAAQTAGTAVANGARPAGTAVAGAAQTAGTAVAGAGQTTAAGSLTPATTPLVTPGGSAFPLYSGAQPVSLTQAQLGQAVPGLSALGSVIDNATYNIYKLTGTADSKPVSDFYKTQLISQGWTDQSSGLSIANQFASFNFLGNRPLFFTKGSQLLMVGVSAPMTQEAITTAGLGGQFKPGDIGILSVSGTPKIKI